MRENEVLPNNDGPYWVDDLAIGEARLDGETATVRLRGHAAEERYYGRSSGER